MHNIDEFEVDKNSDSLQIFKDIKNKIDIFTDNKEISLLCKQYSNLINGSSYPIKQKVKKIIYSSFNFSKGKFNSKSNNFFIINFSFLKVLSYILLIYFFGMKNKKVKKYDLIIDNVDNYQELDRFKKIISKFESVLIISDNKNILKYKKIEIPSTRINIKKLYPDNSLVKNSLLRFVSFFTRVFLYSIKKKYNLIKIFEAVFLSSIKNSTLFNKYKSDYLLQDRFFKLCPVKNYFFKKSGGKINACTQLHLSEASIMLYADTDVLFTFGDEKFSKEKFSWLGGNIKQSFPVGSSKMESLFYQNKKKLNNIENFDLLIIGINPNNWRRISSKVYEGFKEYLNWLKKFSENYPNLKIINKHHENFRGDKLEKNFLQNTNIKEIIKSPENHNSYDYLEKCKVAVSFGSTMIIEGISLNKKCFYADPNSSLSCFYGNLPNLNQILLKDYKTFEDKILNSLLGNSNIPNPIEKKDEICLKSDEVSDRIYNFLKKF